jgi:nucleolar protein 56
MYMDWLTLRNKAMRETKLAIAASVNEDNLITQTMSAIEELDKGSNTLVKRLREWFELYSPEFSKAIGDNEAFTRKILEKSKEEQLADLGLDSSMGAHLSHQDVENMLAFARSIKIMFEERDRLEKYLEGIMKKYCPNVTELAGATIAARLLREAGSLKRLAMIQASTIQLYGAEKALFRHLKTGARPPKHGFIVNHPLVSKAGKQDKGKVARALADKISIAARVDYFKGDPIGESLRKGLEARFS